ncbi:MAG: hypothetical protein IIC13_00945 [SAR324 cluster bacterium]|nr:hypothetical protein [SAR324 cluster bacterium]
MGAENRDGPAPQPFSPSREYPKVARLKRFHHFGWLFEKESRMEYDVALLKQGIREASIPGMSTLLNLGGGSIHAHLWEIEKHERNL